MLGKHGKNTYFYLVKFALMLHKILHRFKMLLNNAMYIKIKNLVLKINEEVVVYYDLNKINYCWLISNILF